MTGNDHIDSGSLVSPKQLEAEGVINQTAAPRAVMRFETGFLLLFLAIAILIFGSQAILYAKRMQAADSAYNEGARLLRDGNMYRAISAFDRAIENNPRFPAALAGRAQANFRMGRYEPALQDYNAALDLNPYAADTLQNRAYVYLQMHDLQKAIKDFDMVLRVDPSNASAYLSRGTSYRELGRYEQAVDNLTAAIQLDPNLAVAYAQRGVTYLKHGEYSKAEPDFRKARNLSSSDMKLHDTVETIIAKAEQQKYEQNN